MRWLPHVDILKRSFTLGVEENPSPAVENVALMEFMPSEISSTSAKVSIAKLSWRLLVVIR
jgi:hypothetical protein